MIKHIIQHKRQEREFSCGAASYAMIMGCDEKTARKECKTIGKGTHIFNVLRALKSRNIQAEIVRLEIDYTDYYHWLSLNSNNRKIYVNGEFVNSHGGRGRYGRTHHTFVACNGFIYDPAENEPIPIESYFHKANKALRLKFMIMIDLD